MCIFSLYSPVNLLSKKKPSWCNRIDPQEIPHLLNSEIYTFLNIFEDPWTTLTQLMNSVFFSHLEHAYNIIIIRIIIHFIYQALLSVAERRLISISFYYCKDLLPIFVGQLCPFDILLSINTFLTVKANK